MPLDHRANVKRRLAGFGRIVTAAAVFALAADDLLGQGAWSYTPTGEFRPVTQQIAPLDVEADEYTCAGLARARFGVDGGGLAVVVIDSGINQVHPAFDGRIVPGRNFSGVGGDGDTTDVYGHGSGVAGIAVGGPGEWGDAGVAPGAKVIPLKILHQRLPGANGPKPATINEALTWVLDLVSNEAKKGRLLADHGVRIGAVNMSLGVGVNAQKLGDLPAAEYFKTWRLVQSLRDHRVVVVAAAGNNFAGHQCKEGMDFPAVLDEVISVGAVYDGDYDFTAGEVGLKYSLGAIAYRARKGRCAPFSQRLAQDAGGLTHTDIFAPGVAVRSAGRFVPGDPAASRGAAVNDGTSRAAPIVAGAVLLLQQRYMQVSGKTDLPPFHFIQQCFEHGHAITDDEEPAACTPTTCLMDNVTSTGKTFVGLDAYQAVEYVQPLYAGAVREAYAAASDGNAPRDLNVLGTTFAPAEY